MTPFESSLLAMLAPVAIALVAWLRAESAHKKLAAKQDKPGG